MIKILSALTLLSSLTFADKIITTQGDEISGTVIELSQTSVSYTPKGEQNLYLNINSNSIFMIKYDDGRKLLFSEYLKDKKEPKKEIDNRFGVELLTKGGFFGLINLNEEYFDPEIYTFGLAPVVDYQISHFFSVGLEGMFLWAQPNHGNISRYFMNLNLQAKVKFPITEQWFFISQLGSGGSIWPGAGDEILKVHEEEKNSDGEKEVTIHDDTMFYKDRWGWNIQLDVGLEYKPFERTSFIFRCGYSGNFSTYEETPATIDMLMVGIGPRITF